MTRWCPRGCGRLSRRTLCAPGDRAPLCQPCFLAKRGVTPEVRVRLDAVRQHQQPKPRKLEIRPRAQQAWLERLYLAERKRA